MTCARLVVVVLACMAAPALAQTPGHLLLTVLVYHEDEGESHRAYSSRPSEYPTGGRKSLEQAPRMRQVLASGPTSDAPARTSLITSGTTACSSQWGAAVSSICLFSGVRKYWAQSICCTARDTTR